MYRLLFAEDESATREGVLAMVDWNALGIGEIKAVRNGALAYETAQAWVPDILLTDIRMPRMDGIALAKRVREINPLCSILILSGYAEVEYLKSAIRLKAVDFVDKPLQLPVLVEQLRNAVAEQDHARTAWMRLRQNIGTLFTQKKAAAARIAEGLAEMGYTVEPESRCMALCLPLIPRSEGVLGQSPGADAYWAEVSRALQEDQIPFTGGVRGDYLLWIQVYETARHPMPALADLADTLEAIWLRQPAAAAYALYLCVSPVMTVSQHKACHEQAVLQGNGIFLRPEEHRLFAETVLEPVLFVSGPGLRYLLDDLTQRAAQGNLPAVQDTLEELLARAREIPGLTKSSVIHTYAHILAASGRTRQLHGSNAEGIYQDLQECATMAEANRCFVELLFPDGEQPEVPHSVAEEVLQIIRTQYADCTLSLNDICQKIHRSPSYVCVKFREETGKTLTQYLHEYRIEASLRLLANPDNKINSVAEAVGFDNGNYYSKIFRRLKHMSPAEYRRKAAPNP